MELPKFKLPFWLRVVVVDPSSVTLGNAGAQDLVVAVERDDEHVLLESIAFIILTQNATKLCRAPSPRLWDMR